ncbi:MAG: serine racemase VanT catalytic subunit [bacterium]|nr:serine racemase VanT catalytic subunit [bacterium]MCM1375322.1 serine racemase VanT catalytic subunit [Muribaculum sp.]MCM1409761.1 serine racemase VanT catalytic subunit [Lachnospiraceae bacterium]
MTNTMEQKKYISTENAEAECASSRSRAWAEISMAALAHNVRYLQSLLPAHCALMPVVKANAYGHGDGLIARELNALGIDSFCVACVSEGVSLRQQNVTGEILVLGYTHPDQFPLLDQYALTQTVVDHVHAQALSTYSCSSSRRLSPAQSSPLPVHIAVDTGMHRLGEPAEHVAQIQNIFALPGLQVTGIYTHLAAADGTDAISQDFTHRQIDTFYKLTAQVKTSVKLHVQASYGILRYPLPDMDCARPGIALYGLLANAQDTRALAGKLRPVLSLRARIASVRQLSAGESAGYNMAFTASRPAVIATITIGYADGLPRSLSEHAGKVLIHGQYAPIVGRICMDQLLADVTAIPGVEPGDIATLIGRDGQEYICAADLADACGTITNELLSCLGPRLERVPIPYS